jgi:hypothetical protein
MHLLRIRFVILHFIFATACRPNAPESSEVQRASSTDTIRWQVISYGEFASLSGAEIFETEIGPSSPSALRESFVDKIGNSGEVLVAEYREWVAPLGKFQGTTFRMPVGGTGLQVEMLRHDGSWKVFGADMHAQFELRRRMRNQ